MARIRTIKPEFPQSESMGNVSRDSRLTFILLWTLADDAGRLRGNSRMLASLLYPYDDDAKEHIDDWLRELEQETCIKRYVVEGASYVQIDNWLMHQKIDKPSRSKIPTFDEASRGFAKAREHSSGDQGSEDQGSEDQRTKDLSLSASPTDTDPVVSIFNHWKEVHKHPKAILDCKRRQIVERALKTFSVELLKECISGYALSPHHTGTDPKGNGTSYDSIELFLRDTQHIEAGMSFAIKKSRQPTALKRAVPFPDTDPYRGAI